MICINELHVSASFMTVDYQDSGVFKPSKKIQGQKVYISCPSAIMRAKSMIESRVKSMKESCPQYQPLSQPSYTSFRESINIKDCCDSHILQSSWKPLIISLLEWNRDEAKIAEHLMVWLSYSLHETKSLPFHLRRELRLPLSHPWPFRDRVNSLSPWNRRVSSFTTESKWRSETEKEEEKSWQDYLPLATIDIFRKFAGREALFCDRVKDSIHSPLWAWVSPP